MSEPIREFEEMYMKTLFELHEAAPGQPITTGRLAEAMEVSAASASEMVQRLAGKGFLDYERYKGATLTHEGMAVASRIKRRHRLLSTFLTEMLDYPGDVNATACRLEHALTDELEETIDRLLGWPERSSEGDLIPPLQRKVDPLNASVLIPLRALPVNSTAAIEVFLMGGADKRTLQRSGIRIGSEITCTEEGFEAGQMMLELSEQLQSRILVRLQDYED
jgi:DtxR family Mn-dependent transcriptional regulator